MNFLVTLFFLPLLFTPLFFALSTKYKIYVSWTIHLVLMIASVSMIILYMQQGRIDYFLADLSLIGPVHLKVDGLSSMFTIVFDIAILLSVFYFVRFSSLENNFRALTIQLCVLAVLHSMLLLACLTQELLVFIMAGEIAGLCFFIRLIFSEGKVSETSRNYLIQLYVSMLLVIVALVWLNSRTGMENFEALLFYFENYPNVPLIALLLFSFVLKIISKPARLTNSLALSFGAIAVLSLYGMIRILQYVEKDWPLVGFLLLIGGGAILLRWFKIKNTLVEKLFQPIKLGEMMSEKRLPYVFLFVFALLIVFEIIKPTYHWMNTVLLLTGLSFLLYATLFAMKTHNSKRLLAYLTMGHVGIIMIALSVGHLGYIAAIVHLICYIAIQATFFLLAGKIFQTDKFYGNETEVRDEFLSRHIFFISILMLLAFPPSGLFISEFILFKALFLKGKWWAMLIVMCSLTILFSVFVKKFLPVVFISDREPENSGKIIFSYRLIAPILLLTVVVWIGAGPPLALIKYIELAIAHFPR